MAPPMSPAGTGNRPCRPIISSAITALHRWAIIAFSLRQPMCRYRRRFGRLGTRCAPLPKCRIWPCWPKCATVAITTCGVMPRMYRVRLMLRGWPKGCVIHPNITTLTPSSSSLPPMAMWLASVSVASMAMKITIRPPVARSWWSIRPVSCRRIATWGCSGH